MLIALLIAAQAPVTPAPVVAPGSVSTMPIKPVGPSDVCPAGKPRGIIVQGGLQPSTNAGIIVQGGKTAGSGIIVQGGLQPGAPSEPATTDRCEKPKR